jgi:predicted transcriptional regulator of viral defense system
MKLDRNHLALLADQHQGLFKAADLIAAGLSFKQIRQLVASGDLEKLGQGIYRAASHPYDERVEIARRIPKGVFCLYSACFLHQLSDFVPSEQHLAIPKKSRYVLPVYPPVKLYYWDTTAFQLGIGDFPLDEGSIRVYDPEKTVCDMLRLREKAGLDVLKEVIKNYLQGSARDLAKLHDYARQLQIEKILHQYLSVLL